MNTTKLMSIVFIVMCVFMTIANDIQVQACSKAPITIIRSVHSNSIIIIFILVIAMTLIILDSIDTIE